MLESVYDQLLQIPQPQLVAVALAGLRCQGEMLASAIESAGKQLGDLVGESKYSGIYLVGCGDSYFVALSARYAFECLTGLPTVALESMEFARYKLLSPDSLVIAISSTGEVTMTLESARVARGTGATVIGITAQGQGRMAQEFPCFVTASNFSENDHVRQVALILGNFAFSLVALYLLAAYIGQRLGRLDDTAAANIESELRSLAGAVEQVVDYGAKVRTYLESVSDEGDFYFLGAGPSYGVALFYQAKFFEQAQRPVYGVHLEEFVHEQFFLLRPDGDAQVWLIAPLGRSQGRALEIMSGCREVGAHIVAVTTPDSGKLWEEADSFFSIEATSEMFSPLVSVVPGELLGIYAFERWGSGISLGLSRSHQMAVSNRLKRTHPAGS